jgi:hypothetical protein
MSAGVEILAHSGLLPARARCSTCGAEWHRPRGSSGRAELEAFTLDHLARHEEPRLFDVEAFSAPACSWPGCRAFGCRAGAECWTERRP